MAGCRGRGCALATLRASAQLVEFGVVETERVGRDLDQRAVGAESSDRDRNAVARHEHEVPVARKLVEEEPELCDAAVVVAFVVARARLQMVDVVDDQCDVVGGVRPHAVHDAPSYRLRRVLPIVSDAERAGDSQQCLERVGSVARRGDEEVQTARVEQVVLDRLVDRRGLAGAGGCRDDRERMVETLEEEGGDPRSVDQPLEGRGRNR